MPRAQAYAPAMLTRAMSSSPDRENEDAVAFFPGGMVLADGAGLPQVLRQGCRHSVAWFSQRIVTEVAARAASAPTLTDAARAAIVAVRESHDGCTLAGGSPSSTLSVVRRRGDELEYLCLADSSVLVVHPGGGTTEIVDTRIDETAFPAAAALLAEWRVTGELTGEEAHVESFRRTGERLRNVPGGFWVAHTDENAVDQAATGSLPLTDVEAVVLASDGVTRGVHLVDLHDADSLARRLVAGDADAVFAEIRAEEDRHAEEFALQRTKLHDDMTFAVLTSADLAE